MTILAPLGWMRLLGASSAPVVGAPEWYMPTPEDQEPLLTVDQAYVAAYCFIRQFYERDGRKPESMFFLLAWMGLEGPRGSHDPAQWNDWTLSVDRALAEGDAVFTSGALPQPLSK